MASADDYAGPPLGVNAAYVSPRPTYLQIKERLSFSGDDFTIRTSEGQDVVRCEGKTMSLSGRKNIYAAAGGTLLFALRGHHFKVPKSYYLESPNGDHAVEIKGRWTFGKAKMDAHFKNACGGGEEAVLEVRGSFFDRKADILIGDKVVARVRREFANVREILGAMQTYMVWVAPNVDLSLIAALVVALDESQNDNKSSGS